MKHFPGDGTEENDQHLLMGVNDMTCEEWDNTFGRVYKELIDEGVMTIMAGHIALPAYTRKLRPDTADEDILPGNPVPGADYGFIEGPSWIQWPGSNRRVSHDRHVCSHASPGSGSAGDCRGLRYVPVLQRIRTKISRRC